MNRFSKFFILIRLSTELIGSLLMDQLFTMGIFIVLSPLNQLWGSSVHNSSKNDILDSQSKDTLINYLFKHW